MAFKMKNLSKSVEEEGEKFHNKIHHLTADKSPSTWCIV